MNLFENKYIRYKKIIDERLDVFIEKSTPKYLYEPLKYILAGGGKRIRPMLLIFSCEAAGGNFEQALDAAIAIETLHNFTLIHDDIMDNADTRRGKETIHKKWNRDVAILAGDALLGLSYKSLLKTESPRIKAISEAFTEAVIEVCEGQSYDKEFELRKEVTIDDYLMMINKKTSQLLMCSAKIGGLIGDGNADYINAVTKYAENLGLAFQVQDDLLDITGDEKKFGKKIGGDLREGKKTFLLLRALDSVTKGNDRQLLDSIIKNKGTDSDAEVMKIKEIYKNHGILDFAAETIEKYTNKADKFINTLKDSGEKETLRWFSKMLMGRSS